LSDIPPIQNGLKQGDALSPLLFNFTSAYAVMIKSSVSSLVIAEYQLLTVQLNTANR
jgi:hypothetical protein